MSLTPAANVLETIRESAECPFHERGLQVLVALLAAHLLSRYVLPTRAREAQGSTQPWAWRGWRLTIYSSAFAWLFVGTWWAWWIPVGAAVPHLLWEFLKRPKPDSQSDFWLNLSVHAAMALLLSSWSPEKVLASSLWFADYRTGAGKFYATVCGLILAINVGSKVVGFWTAKYAEQLRETAASGGEQSQSPRSADDGLLILGRTETLRGFLDGGKTIGQWERALIFMLVLNGQFQAVGFLVAAKSVFRFGEISHPRSNRMEAEYIIIGTLISFTWATSITLCTCWLRDLPQFGQQPRAQAAVTAPANPAPPATPTPNPTPRNTT